MLHGRNEPIAPLSNVTACVVYPSAASPTRSFIFPQFEKLVIKPLEDSTVTNPEGRHFDSLGCAPGQKWKTRPILRRLLRLDIGVAFFAEAATAPSLALALAEKLKIGVKPATH